LQLIYCNIQGIYFPENVGIEAGSWSRLFAEKISKRYYTELDMLVLCKNPKKCFSAG